MNHSMVSALTTCKTFSQIEAMIPGALCARFFPNVAHG